MTSARALAFGRVALLAALAIVWTVLSWAFGDDTIPRPLSVAWRLVDAATGGDLWDHAATTLAEAGGGLVIGVVLGIACAVALERRRRLGAAIAPLFTGIMGLPKLALAPVITLWFGIGLSSKIAFVGFGVFFIVFFNMQSGLRAVDPTLVAMARLMGARPWAVTRHVLIPSTLPFLFGTLKVVVPHSITMAVVAELVVSRAGLGYYIKACAAQADTPGIFVGVAVVMLIVVGAGTVLERGQSSWLSWRA